MTAERFTLEQTFGNHRGGWYRDNETGDRKFVKIYSNPDQSKIEVLANNLTHTLIYLRQSLLYTS